MRPNKVSNEMEAVMLGFSNVADVLGLPAKEAAVRSPFGLMSRIERCFGEDFDGDGAIG